MRARLYGNPRQTLASPSSTSGFRFLPRSPAGRSLSQARGWLAAGAQSPVRYARSGMSSLSPQRQGEGCRARSGSTAPAAPRPLPTAGPARLGPPVRCRGAHGCRLSVACGPCPAGTGAADICQTWALSARWRSSGRCQAAFNWHPCLPFCENRSASLCFFI